MTVSKTGVIVGIIVAIPVVLLAAVASYLYFGGGERLATTEPSPTPTPELTSSPAPSLTPRHEPHPDHDRGIPEFAAKYPAVERLPWTTQYWSLVVDGEIEDGILPLEATVYVRSEEAGRREIGKQRPYIERYLESIGQRKGTYRLEIVADAAPDGI